jgi:membrane protease subunit HflC
MSRIPVRWLAAAVIVLLIGLKATTFTVRQGNTSVVTRLGKPTRVITDPGLHLRWPWPVETANNIDSRRKAFTTRFAETLTKDKKNVILVNFAVWSVDDPLRFLQSVVSSSEAEAKLDGMISNAKNAVMGNYDLSALVSTDQDLLKIPDIEDAILNEVKDQALSKLGIRVWHVGIRRIALPEENVRYVFDQMRAERSQFAARAIAEGRRIATAIRAQTEVERAAILADAKEEAAQIRGQAEAEAARLYAEAQQTDPRFFKFLRSLEALKRLIGEKSTVILRTDSDPFDLLEKESPTK